MRDTALRVKDIAEDFQLTFVSEPMECQIIHDEIGENADGFDAFFVEVVNGEYVRVFGMYGTTPHAYRTLTTLR